MENIKVYDNFLTNEELNECLKIINSSKWTFGHLSNTLTQCNFNVPFWSIDLKHEDFFSVYLKEVIEKHFLKKFTLTRVYANGQTFGQDGSYHIDDDSSNTYTFCLYLSNIEEIDLYAAGGHLMIKIPNEKYNICYEPVFNRGIFFPSNYLHKSNSFSRFVMDLRIVVAWKLKEIID